MKKAKQSMAVTTIYLLLAFVSAFELFLIQPLIAKHILPLFGGTASVWTACLLFFQTMLFLGYLYAYLISFARLSIQVATQTALIILSIALLVWQCISWGIPIIIPPSDLTFVNYMRQPTLAVIILLTISVGLPYIILSSTSPLIQAWFYGKSDERKKPLYFFYAVSNTGSLIALLLYPFILEPILKLQQQAIVWSMGYITFAIVFTICSIHALRSLRNAVKTTESPSTPLTNPQSPSDHSNGIIWLGLSATATLMLIAITNQICANVAPVPLLWILPLTIYLLAFIICFSSHATHIPTVAALIMLPATALLLFIMKHELSLGILPQLAAYVIAFFCACMLCLGLLHKLRPPPKQLTFFYLMIALGGAIGGLFVGVVAPIIFNDYFELRIGLMISCAIATWLLFNQSWMTTWRIPLIFSAIAIAVSLAYPPHKKNLITIEKSRNFYGTLKVVKEEQPRGVNVYSLMHGRICHGLQFDRGPFSRLPSAYFGPNSGIGIAFANHPKRKRAEDRSQKLEVRSKKSEVSGQKSEVRSQGSVAEECSGEIVSRQTSTSEESTVPPSPNDHPPMTNPQSPPTNSPITNPPMTNDQSPNHQMNIGVLGLGIGTVAAYAKKGDHIRFYELNPEVVRMATNTDHFRYISSCEAKVDIVLGDARLSLEKELKENGSHNFDILNMDAFNGDAIPVHLLTVEAFKTYLAHLNPNGGVLAIQITNMYLNLVPVVAGIAKYYNLKGYVVKGTGDMRLTSDCLWVLLSRDQDYNPIAPKGADIKPLDTNKNTILWTDNFSNIITILKKRLFVK